MAMNKQAGEWLKLACSVLLTLNTIAVALLLGVTFSSGGTNSFERMTIYGLAFVSFLGGTISCLAGICLGDVHGYFCRLEASATVKPKLATAAKSQKRPEDDLPADWLKS